MTQVKAFVTSQFLDDTVSPGFAFITGNKLVIEEVTGNFHFFDTEEQPKAILTTDLKSVTLEEDNLCIVLSYSHLDVRFALVQTFEEWQQHIFRCIQLASK